MNSERTFFGHPRGLATLFFTEMWERFSYYGMRALLLLFMVASVEEGGMGFDDKTGGAIYGLYTMFVYLLALPGGWLADKLFGLRKSIFYGGCIIALGHFCLAFPFNETFFLGLLFIVIQHVGAGGGRAHVPSRIGGTDLEGVDAVGGRGQGGVVGRRARGPGASVHPALTGAVFLQGERPPRGGGARGVVGDSVIVGALGATRSSV